MPGASGRNRVSSTLRAAVQGKFIVMGWCEGPLLGYLLASAMVCQHHLMEHSDIRTAAVAFVLAGILPAVMIIVLMLR